MAIKLLTNWGPYAPNTIVRTLDAATEAALIVDKIATATLTGGVEVVAPAPSIPAGDYALLIRDAAGRPTGLQTSAGNRPAQNTAFGLPGGGGIGRITFSLPSTATAAETVTLTWYLRDGTTAAASSTISPGASEDWPINLLDAAYFMWSSTGPTAILETR